MNNYSYPWPASAITESDMALLHSIRESSQPRIPITRLISKAIQAAYGNADNSLPETPSTGENRYA
ncbi:MAG: hypothetical protein PF904_01835 [Kiritimatiellae bacterium]|nr:hypothetical protein [Kiritimatiellia bacterium]